LAFDLGAVGVGRGNMYTGKTIGVVIRAFNEEGYIKAVIDSIPEYVDSIYIVNDASTDRTLERVREAMRKDSRIVLVNRTVRGGPGSAAISGHKRALGDSNDVVVMLDGDGQMDPELLNRFLDPLVSGEADYVKGDRLSNREHRREMPAFRTFGNFLLTNLTRLASGYWHISDPQNGYTAISTETIKKLDLAKIEKGFAFENDMLVKLNTIGAKIKDIPHAAIYRGQHSKIHYSRFIFQTSWILLKDFFWRLWVELIKKKDVALEKEANSTKKLLSRY
jgi:glycosyltransferase involved in cell wall biosynthesis